MKKRTRIVQKERRRKERERKIKEMGVLTI